jgi:hypothetical protein
MFSVFPFSVVAICEWGRVTVPTGATICELPTRPKLGRAVELQRILRSMESLVWLVVFSTRQLDTT